MTGRRNGIGAYSAIRRTIPSAGAAITAGALAIVLPVGAGTSAAAAPPGGRWEDMPVPAGQEVEFMLSVAAPGPRSAWAVGDQIGANLVLHWDGRSWSRQEVPAGDWSEVAAAGPRRAWILGTQSGLYWNGRRWNPVPYPPAYSPRAVAAEPAGTAWAVGNGGVLRFEGGRWVPQPAPVPEGGVVRTVAARSQRDVWVGGVHHVPSSGTPSDGSPFVLRWDGRRWTRVPLPAAMRGEVYDVTRVSARSAWLRVGAAGPSRDLWHWDGTRWTWQTRMPYDSYLGFAFEYPGTLVDDGNGGVWAGAFMGGGMRYRHWDGQRWTSHYGPGPLENVHSIGDLAPIGHSRSMLSVGLRVGDTGRTPVIQRYRLAP